MHYKKNVKGYLCGSYNKYGLKKCTDHLVREADLVSIILQDIRTFVSNLNNETAIKKLESQIKKQNQQNEKDIQTVNAQIEKLKHRKRQAHDKHFDGDMPKSEYDEYVASINQELNELKFKKQQYDELL